MKAITTAFIMSWMLLTLSGCVSQAQYDELDLAYRKSQEQVIELQQRIAELEQRIKLLEQNPIDQQKTIDELTKQRDALAAKLGDLQGRIDALAQNTNITVALPKDIDDALKQFAAENPGIVEYDSARGMVKFKSDVTFGLGSDQLTAGARATITKFAAILNAGAAVNYEARVIGHTDTVRIAKPATKAKHPTNWHLSVHRAISVRDAIQAAGVSPIRTSVAGYGPYRPVVNNTARGADKNRRVEIYLVPMTPVNQEYLKNNAPANNTPQPQPTVPDNSNDDIPLK